MASVTRMLADLGVIKRPHNSAEMKLALSRGTAVHKACELHDAGTLDPQSVHPMVVPYLDAYCRWKQEFRQPTVLFWERRLHHPAGYHGRLDTLQVVLGRTTLIDLKSGTDDPATIYQLALYLDLVEVQQPAIAPPIKEVAALVVRDDGSYRWKSYDRATALAAVSDARALVRAHYVLGRLHRLPSGER